MNHVLRGSRSMLMHIASAEFCSGHLRLNPFRAPILKNLLRFDLDKSVIQSLPVKHYDGKVVVINASEDENRPALYSAISRLSECGTIGFDTESQPRSLFNPDCPSAESGSKVAVVQLASSDIAVVWRIPRKKNGGTMKYFPKYLKLLLENRSLCKVGCGVTQDIQSLFNEHSVSLNNVVDIQHYGNVLAVSKHNGLVGLAAEFCHWRVSKAQQKSNWNQAPLTPAQIKYAATDAWTILTVHNAVERFITSLNLNRPLAIESGAELVMKNTEDEDLKAMMQLSSAISKTAEDMTSSQRPPPTSLARSDQVDSTEDSTAKENTMMMSSSFVSQRLGMCL